MSTTASAGDSIYHARREQRMTQDQLSKASGVSRKTISNIETGKTAGHPRILSMISEVLNIDLGDAQIDHDADIDAVLLPFSRLLEEVPARDQPKAIADMFRALSRWLPEDRETNRTGVNLPERTGLEATSEE